MSEIQETPLPGVGVRYDFATSLGDRIGIVVHRSGRRQFLIYGREDPDLCREAIDLDERDSRTLAELLGASQVTEQLVRLQQDVEGLAIDWLPLEPDSPFAGRTIGDTQARTRTGVSVVAVLRNGGAVAAPGPDFTIEGGDSLVVVGTADGIARLTSILRSG